MAEDNGVVIVKSLLVFSSGKGLKGSYRMNLLFTLMSTWIIQHSLAQVRLGETIRWCTVNVEEQAKCSNLSQALNEDKLKNQLTQNYTLTCKLASNKEECMNLLDQDQADITSLDAGDVFIGGRYHSLIPITQEIYANAETNYYAVAVIKNGTFKDADHIRRLRNKKACFAGVGSLAGWVIPIEMLMKEGGLEVIDCNNHVKSAINYFGPSCAVNSLIDKYNPVGDNPDKLCQLCIGRVPGERCTPTDPYAGFEGAFRCLVEVGDVAFLKHTTVEEMTKSKQDFVSLKMENFLLLCPDGRKRAVTDYHHCHWGKVPGDTIVTTSAKSAHVKKSYQKFLGELVKLYGKNETDANTLIKSQTDRNFYSQFNQDNQRARGSIFDTTPAIHSFTNFKLFESAPVYGSKHDLLIQDTAIGLHPLPDSRQTFSGYLEDSLNSILRIRQCPVNKMTLCVTSDPEYEKCVKMLTALKAQLLKPEMSCYKARSHIHCMQAIRSGNADVAVFDAGDVYTAGLQYEEIPFISEVYNLGKPEYYVVAVAREEDPSTELTYLKGILETNNMGAYYSGLKTAKQFLAFTNGKYTCHTGLYTGAGWIIPMAYLLSNGWIRSYGCDSVKAASEYFAKSCVPGALNPEYASGAPYDNLCQLCHGTSYRYCRRDSSEDYYGYTGAFRCLVEGGGNVAFVKHTTVHENADGRRRQWWARNALNEDFQLLCPDGTRSTLADYKKCNLGKVKANAIVTRGGEGYNHTELLAYINLFVYAQQFYSRKDNDDFSMFKSPEPYGDLIFQDATVQLRVIEPEKRHFISYLGQDFMRARRIVDCHAGSDIKYLSFSLILAPFVLLFF